MREFTWQPDWNMRRKNKPSVSAIEFGDGYEQRRKNGINHNLRTYDVTFSGVEDRIEAIANFLEEHNAVNAFLWTPYGDKQGRFVCAEWDTDKQTGFSTLTATFKEVVA